MSLKENLDTQEAAFQPLKNPQNILQQKKRLWILLQSLTSMFSYAVFGFPTNGIDVTKTLELE